MSTRKRVIRTLQSLALLFFFAWFLIGTTHTLKKVDEIFQEYLMVEEEGGEP